MLVRPVPRPRATRAKGSTQQASAEKTAPMLATVPRAATPRSARSVAGTAFPLGNCRLLFDSLLCATCSHYRIKKNLMSRIPIGELSRRTGVNIETIRYFEKVGIIAAPPRTEGGHRVYDDEHVRALGFIRRARELGFTPHEVRAILNLGGPGKACCDEVREIAAHHLEQVRVKMADLAQLERLLASTIDHCSGGTAPDCAVIDMIEDATA